MKVYVAALIRMEDAEFLGVYTSEDLAIGRIEKEMEKLQQNNADLGIVPSIVESYLDDVEVYT